MPRANRHFLPNHIWHITHRCHGQEFLLKFAKDRQRWRYWLYQAKKRFGLCNKKGSPISRRLSSGRARTK